MSVEGTIFHALRGLVSDRVFQDVVPPDIKALPRIVYQQVGGRGLNFIENAVVGLKNGRFQFTVWGATRLQAITLARQVEDTLKVTLALHTTILGAPFAVYETETKLYGTHQDFSFWF